MFIFSQFNINATQEALMDALNGYTHEYIKGYAQRYSVTVCGRVYSHVSARFLIPVLDSHGYITICLRRDNKPRAKRLHRLVALAFLDNPEGLNVINHLNEVKTDNRLENLEWTTSGENSAYSLAATYEITSPTGLLNTFRNLSKFCRDNKLHTSSLYKMWKGRQSQHKGYTSLRRIDINALKEVSHGNA